MSTASKKIIRGWAFYDWANSAYSLIITSAIFPAYYSAIMPQQVYFLGRYFEKTSLASYSISFSFLLVAFLSPILSSVADYKRNKKVFMKFFCYLGSLSCLAMFFFTSAHVWIGILCSMLASIGYCGSLVFYNAYLPEIAEKEQQDAVSAKGFAMGYIGSVLLMIICLAFIMLNDTYGWMNSSLPSRISFVAVAVWWAGFAQITFQALPVSEVTTHIEKRNLLLHGFYELKMVWNQFKHHTALKHFLQSFFFYNTGVQTVMYIAVYFAASEIHLQTSQLIFTVLIIQLVAIAGAWLFAFLSKKTGNISTLIIAIVIWIGICLLAYNTYTPQQFYFLAFCVGLVMGGIQSLSRSTYSKLLPPTHDTASYFSFYDVCDKLGTVLGTLSFGYVGEFLGGLRNSVLTLMIFFIIGLFLLLRVKMKPTFTT